MDVKLGPGEQLSDEQTNVLQRAFNYVATTNPQFRKRRAAGETQLVLKTEIPRLIRGVGKAPTSEELKDIMKMLPEGQQELNFDTFVKLFYRASAEKKTLNEGELYENLKALDLSGTDTLDPKAFKDMMCLMGDMMQRSEIDKILEGLPRNRLGRISCRLIARRLAGGPDGIQFV